MQPGWLLFAAGALCPPAGRPGAETAPPTGQLMGHVRGRQWRAALALLEQLEGDAETLHYNLALQACRRAGEWEPAVDLFERMLRREARVPPPDAASFTTAVAALESAPAGSWRVAMRLLNAIRTQEVGGVEDESLRACFNAAITALGRDGEWCQAIELLRDMQAGGGPLPDAITYNACLGALSSAGEWRRALGLLEEMERSVGQKQHEGGHASDFLDLGFDGSWSLDVDVADEVDGLFPSLERAADGMATSSVIAPPPDAISYVSVMSACRQAGKWKRAVSLLGRMKRHGVRPNAHAFSAAISACASAGEWVHAIAILEKMEAEGLPPSAVAYSATIAACGRGGAWERALQLLKAMERRRIVHKSAHAYNAAISACARAAQWRQALKLLKQMEERKGMAPAPDVFSFNSALSACDRAGEWRIALQLRARMNRAHVRPDAVTDNILLSAFARGARWRSALALLRLLDQRRLPESSRRSSAFGMSPRSDLSARTRSRAARRIASHHADPVPLCTAAAACEAAGEWRACVGLVAPMLVLKTIEPPSPPVAAAAAAAVRAAGGVPTLAIAPALGSAVRACAGAGKLTVMLELVDASHSLLGAGCLPTSAYAAAREAAAAAGDHEAEARLNQMWRNSTDEVSPRAGGKCEAKVMSNARWNGDPTRAGGAKVELAQAQFVLEGARVACGNGENRSSAADIFLVRGPNGTGMVATVDAAREARGLVLRMQRRTDYTPELSALPPHVGRRSVSRTRGRMLLAQHAEKKALAAQLTLGYRRPSITFNKRMCLDCHELFKAASKAWRTPEGRRVTIECRDASRLHIFHSGSCSCNDAAFLPRPNSHATSAEPQGDASRIPRIETSSSVAGRPRVRRSRDPASDDNG